VKAFAILVYRSADEKFHSQVLLWRCTKNIASREIKKIKAHFVATVWQIFILKFLPEC